VVRCPRAFSDAMSRPRIVDRGRECPLASVDHLAPRGIKAEGGVESQRIDHADHLTRHIKKTRDSRAQRIDLARPGVPPHRTQRNSALPAG
jgi:hypothetical protein